MKKLLHRLYEHDTLTRAEAASAMDAIATGEVPEPQIASFLTVYLMRTPTLPELQGFRDALLSRALPISVSSEVIDIVGTGGDGKNTFNISTAASFVAAGAGVRVAKHGNYASTSVTGSSNLLQTLGYRFEPSAEKAEKELEACGFTFLHAPLFHPALSGVAALRKSLGFRTLFNMLGPLANPARPGYQLLGVFNLELARLYTYLLQAEGLQYTIVHALDGYDEVSLTGETRIIDGDGEHTYAPEYLGKRRVEAASISGGDSPAAAAAIFSAVLEGRGTWSQNAVVLANAALALYGSGKYTTYELAYEAAIESLESGRAADVLHTLLSMQ